MSQRALPFSAALTDQLTYTLIISAVVALALAYLILRLYRRAVSKSMRRRSQSELLETRGYLPPEPDHRPHDAPLHFNFVTRSTLGKSENASRLYRTVLWRRWRAGLIHAVAGACFAATMSAAILAADRVDFASFSFFYLTWVNAWPVVLAVNLAVGFSRRGRLIGAALYFLVGGLIGFLAVVNSPSLPLGRLINLWLHGNVPVTLLLAIFLHRRIRAVGPLMLIFVILTVTGANFIVTSTRSHPKFLKALGEFTSPLGLGAQGSVVALQVMEFAVLALAGWVVLGALSKLYQTKSISEQSITIDAVWLLFGIINAVGVSIRGLPWIFTTVAAFAVYKLVSVAAFRMFGKARRAGVRGRRLLLLRAFAFGTRRDTLYDTLAKSWRTVGSIQMIAGRNLATTGIEPHEFWDFISGNLPRRFIDSGRTLDLRIDHMDLAPDHDGQFRVTEFFCHEDTWKMTLARLADESEAVLMDLRGFSRANSAYRIEIDELFNVVALAKILFAVNQTTDQPFTREVMEKAWSEVKARSPNRRLLAGQVSLVDISGMSAARLHNLLYGLCAAATARAN